MPKKLSQYNKKRDFKITAEPEGKVAKSRSGFSYLIQKHAATRLHYDFRLELDGVLKSWAVTRGPSYNPKDKRLAVEVEDHPLAYGSFEGTIPHGQYGGGTVMLWDRGSWEPVGDAREGIKKGHLNFILHGERMKGEWSLVLMHNRGEKRNNWLLVKKEDEHSNNKDAETFLAKENLSISSKRNMDEISKGGEVWKSKKAKVEKVKPVKFKKKPRAKSIQIPEFIEPQLATLSDTMPNGDEWIHEVKFDGYRVLARVEKGGAKMLTRNGNDWSDKFSGLAAELAGFDIENAIFDGEIVAPDESGNSNFMELQQALSDKDDSKLQYYIFDLLFLNGQDLRGLPLIERKEKLREVLKNNNSEKVFLSESFKSKKGDFIQKACQMKLEGVISKMANEPYTSGRSKSWLKSKCHQRQEFVIGGYTLQSNGSNNLGALLVGVYNDGQFIYAGRVGTGFNAKTSTALLKKLKALKQDECPFATPPKSKNRYGIIWVKPKSGGTWVEPKLVCEVEFAEWTRDNILRHPSFQGLREDKKPAQVKHEVAVHQPAKSEITEEKKEKATFNGINITHPERVVYPDSNITKSDIANYYLEIADKIIPYIINRPLNVLRCPAGFKQTCFFQRHLASGLNDKHVSHKNLKASTQPIILVKDVKGLLSLVQMGVLEIHPWGSTVKNLDKPDRMIFDLDPAPDVSWQKVINGAFEVRDRMHEMGLTSFIKTTGGKGLHVVVPIKPKYNWETVKGFTKAIAQSMEHDNPKLYLSKISKAQRKGRIFIDYLRNEHSASAVSVYSTRAREGATISMPVSWEQLTTKLDPKKFNVKSNIKSLVNDAWEEFYDTKQSLDHKIIKVLQLSSS